MKRRTAAKRRDIFAFILIGAVVSVLYMAGTILSSPRQTVIGIPPAHADIEAEHEDFHAYAPFRYRQRVLHFFKQNLSRRQPT